MRYCIVSLLLGVSLTCSAADSTEFDSATDVMLPNQLAAEQIPLGTEYVGSANLRDAIQINGSIRELDIGTTYHYLLVEVDCGSMRNLTVNTEKICTGRENSFHVPARPKLDTANDLNHSGYKLITHKANAWIGGFEPKETAAYLARSRTPELLVTDGWIHAFR